MGVVYRIRVLVQHQEVRQAAVIPLGLEGTISVNLLAIVSKTVCFLSLAGWATLHRQAIIRRRIQARSSGLCLEYSLFLSPPSASSGSAIVGKGGPSGPKRNL